MKTLLTAVLSLILLSPIFAGPHGGHEIGRREGGTRHHDNDRWGHERHEGWRGNRGHFNGFNGTFYGQIIILNDGCYFWDGLMWEPYYDCE